MVLDHSSDVGSELENFPASGSDDNEENPFQGFYINYLVSDDPCTTHLDLSGATVSTDDDDYIAYVEHNLAYGDVESYHGLYWRCDGDLEDL
jgi:hypothetical protein